LSTVVTYKHASSASLSTSLQLMGGATESEEPGKYDLGNSEPMAPEDSRAEDAPPGAALPVPMIPHGAPRTPRTSIDNDTDTVDG
jgi:hypothetical protein